MSYQKNHEKYQKLTLLQKTRLKHDNHDIGLNDRRFDDANSVLQLIV